MLINVTQALGEMAIVYPVSGGFYTLAVRFLDPSWGFAMVSLEISVLIALIFLGQATPDADIFAARSFDRVGTTSSNGLPSCHSKSLQRRSPCNTGRRA
jgi:hypothetical protein